MLSRRGFLRLGVGTGSLGLVAWLGSEPEAPAQLVLAPNLPRAWGRYTFFSAAEIAFIDAAVARLIPTDVLGPGAVEAGVTLFIDQQLAGRYGHAVDWYMGGPWADGTDEQGYQSKLNPAEFYRAGIAAVDEHCRGAFDQKVFAALRPADRDAVLKGLEKGDIKLTGISAKDFFDMLWQNTQEGYFADPVYEGNRDFIGWKLVGYPGPRYNYTSEIRHYGQPYLLPTVGLMGRDPSRHPRGTA